MKKIKLTPNMLSNSLRGMFNCSSPHNSHVVNWQGCTR